MFIFIRSISCGAFIVPEQSRDGDFLVVDVVDTDMFLRICHDSSPVSFISINDSHSRFMTHILASGLMTLTMTHHCTTTCDSS
jgi:predicted thioredoxin/glutaredoxin